MEPFPSTHWSSVLAAREAHGENGCQALGVFLCRYERALVSYLTKKFGHDPGEAADLFHEFILQVIIKRELLAKANPAKGFQFRRFLLCSLHAFAISEFRRRRAKKRRPSSGLDSLEEMGDDDIRLAGGPAAELFDVEWARTILREAIRRMEEQCSESGLIAIWGVFENRVRRPILDGSASLSYDELVRLYGFISPTQAHNALVTAKRMFVRSLRVVISEYVTDEGAVDLEMRELQMILSHAG